MDAQNWQEIQDLFNQAVDLPRAERDALLAEAPEHLRLAVLPLLEVDTRAMDGLRAAVSEAGIAAVGAIPRRFGAWRVTGILGEGGMGTVYRGVRDDQAFEKEVAIKVLHLGGLDSVSRARFVQERWILAVLEHPNIARLIDGGEDGDGTGYIVMEYVDGRGILEYADQHQLDLEARLRLFLPVCAAVQYAHRNLVVHRDLKPGNILVDSSGEPKLLDFGIAKLVDTNTPRTLTGLQTLTPQYASPEQVRGEPITTASDVYSLGVVLYELLTGRRPYEFASMMPLEIDRVVCQTAPKPSGLPGDLDTILSMAMRKEPARRYESVERLAADCRNYLEQRPVSARPDTLRYRAGKFVARNWMPLGAVAAVLLAVAAGSAVALQQARVARTRFDDVRRLAHTFIFDFQDQAAKVNGNTKLREQMVQTALDYLGNLARSAGNDTDLLKELAGGYERVGEVQGLPSEPNIGRPAEALISFARAAEFHERVTRMEPRYGWTLMKFYNNYATMLRQTGDFARAVQVLAVGRGHLEEAQKARPDALSLKVDYANSWCLAGDIEEDQSHLPAALQAHSKCRELAGQLLSVSRSPAVLAAAVRATERVGGSAAATGRFDLAIASFDDEERFATELLRSEPNDPRYKRNLAILAQYRAGVYCSDDHPSLEQPAPCLRYSKEYLEKARSLSEGDPSNQSARTSVAIAMSRVSWAGQFVDPAESVRVGQQSIRIFDELIAAGNKGTFLASRRARALRRLAESWLAAKKPREALATANEALSLQRSIAARNPADPAEAGFLCRALLAAARASAANGDAAAEGLFLESEALALKTWNRNQGDMPTVKQLADTRVALGEWFRSRREEDRARDWYGKALGVWRGFADRNPAERGPYVDRKIGELQRLVAGS